MELILTVCGTKWIFILRASFAARRSKTNFSGKKLVRYVTQISAYFNKLYVFTMLKANSGQSARMAF